MISTNFTPFPILSTDRLILRQLETTDDEAIFTHRSDDLVNTYLEDFRHASIAQTRSFIERVQREIADGRTILWVITRKGSNKFIGTVCLWNISKEEAKAETGYTLVSGFHKMGYMNEALAKIIDFGFNIMKLRTIEAYAHQHNAGSIQLLLKNNFKRGALKKPVGTDRVYLSLTNESYAISHKS